MKGNASIYYHFGEINFHFSFFLRNYKRHTVNTDMQSDQAAKENIFYFDQKRLKTTFLGDKRSQSNIQLLGRA